MIGRCLFSLFMVAFTANAKGQVLPQQETDINILNSIAYKIDIDKRESGQRAGEVRGIPFVFERWLTGSMTLDDGRVVSWDSSFNIDATDEGSLLVLLPNGDAVDVREELIREVIIRSVNGDQVFKPFDVEVFDGKESGICLVEVLFENAGVTLLKWHVKYLREPDFKGAYSIGRPYHEYVDNSKYYIGIDHVYFKIRMNKGSIRRVSSDLANSLKGEVTEESLVEAMGKVFGGDPR